VTDEKQWRVDMGLLLQRPEFLRFLWTTIQISGLFGRTTDGSDGRDLAFDEGRRHLGLEILEMVEKGQPVAHPGGLPILTLIQTLREEASTGARNAASRDRYDRYADTDPDAAAA